MYVGNWVSGQQDNVRVYVLPNGQVKKAMWENGKKGEYIALSEDEIKNYLREKEEAIRAASGIESKFRQL